MKKYNVILFVLLTILLCSCVQKSKMQTVIFMLDVKGFKDIKTVGIRGEDKPLSWDTDLKMDLGKDSIYTATVSGETGYLFSEFKFSINNELELKDKDNRRVYFAKNGQTIYKAKFNVAK